VSAATTTCQACGDTGVTFAGLPCHRCDAEPAPRTNGQEPTPPPTDADAPKDAKAAKDRRGEVGALAVRLASEVTAKPVRWFWKDRLAYGKLNVLGGAPGLGKSYITTYLAGAASTGGPLPGDERADAEAGSVVILSYEDDPEDTLRPRLDLVGADLDRVHLVEGVNDGRRRRALGPEDVALLAAHIEKLGDVQLVIVDPVSAFVGAGTDEHRGNEIRAALEDLRLLAQNHSCAIVLVMHTRKAGADTALNRLAGSQAYGALVRSALMVAPVADDEDGRSALAHVKHNLAAKQPTLAYTVGEQGVAWCGEIEIDEGEVAGNGADEHGGGRQEATDFLRDLLADGPVGAREVRDQAEDAGIAARTLDRAKKALNVVSARSGTTWSWSLPTPPRTPRSPTSPGVNPGDLGDVGDVEPCADCSEPATSHDRDGKQRCGRCVSWAA
jgi:putative DNA primase/helicase